MRLTKPQKLIYNMDKFVGGSISVGCGSMILRRKKDISEMKKAVNEIFRLNDALRIRIGEKDGIPFQYVEDFQEKEIEILYFKDKAQLDDYANICVKEPIDMFGSLSDIKLFELDDGCGIFVKMHHIISDAWTASLIFTQFNKLLNGETPECYSYCDYISSEDVYLSGKRYEKDRAFFIDQFKKCDKVTFINEKPSQTSMAKRKAFVVDGIKTQKIVEYAQKNNSSVFTLFLTALSVYINRTKMNAEKFYIGTAVLNRTTVKEKNTLGMFVNTVPVLIELDNNNKFSANAENVQDSVFSVLRHQKYNYGDVLTDIRKEYNFTEKLYDVMFSYQNAQVTGTEDEFETTWYHPGMQTESLQIHIEDRDNKGALTVLYDYLIEKFTEHEIETLHEHIFNILFDVIENDSKEIYELNILAETKKQKLLCDFNDTANEYNIPDNSTLYSVFETTAKKNRNKTCIKTAEKSLTFGELLTVSENLDTEIRSITKGKKSVIAVIAERSVEMYAAIYGIIRGGNAYLPIDPDYPKERIAYILKNSEAAIVIAQGKFTHLSGNVPCIDMSSFVNDSEKQSKTPLSCAAEENDTAYVIYTSGSTGNPKGAKISHKSAINRILWMQDKYPMEENSVILQKTPYTFDVSVWELFWWGVCGGSLSASKPGEHFLPEKILGEINNAKVTHLHFVPSVFDLFLNYLEGHKDECFKFNSVKHVFLSGEALTASLIQRFYKLFNFCNVKLHNLYGPTECAVDVTYYDCSPDDIDPVPIGKPIYNTQMYVVDKYMCILPIGVTGELCIGGVNVGQGYLNNEALTAEKFIDNPFGEGKLYKTGDLAYWREDGNIVYVGRNDFQVKVRGLRIELGEIENAITSIEGIENAVVIVRNDEADRQLICAFYTGEKKDSAEIRHMIGKKLPKYMLPHSFTYLEEMPLTSSGKIDRKALPEVDLENIETSVEYVEPQTEREKLLVSAIETILKAEKVGVNDNFFDLGGDSLKAIELTAILESKGYSVEIRKIFDSENIAEIAESIKENTAEEAPVEYGNVLAATPAQMRVYTAQMLDEGSTLYNIPYAFKTESVDAEKLEEAINKLVERHESLRTHFENRNGEIVQVIDEKAKVNVQKLESEDISDFIKPFDLEKSPLIHVGYYENTVMIDLHHIIADGESLPVFYRELNELYMGRTLNDTPVQYGEFAVKTGYTKENEEYWLGVYEDEVPALSLNTDYPRKSERSFNGNNIYEKIDIELHKKISDKCRALSITSYVYYMAAFNILMSKYSTEEDIVVGTPASGRTAKYLETIGMFVNTLAVRNKPEGTKTVKEFLEEVRENSVKALDNQNYPFGTLVKKLGIEANGRNPLYDVTFAYESEKSTDIVFGDQRAELLTTPLHTAKNDLSFYIMPRENDVVLMAEYCTELFEQSTIKKYIASYKNILSELLKEERYIKDISAISEAEKQKLLYDFNDNAVPYDKSKHIYEIFAQQVKRTPRRDAVIYKDNKLSYTELYQQINEYADKLSSVGIKKGDVVAVHLDKSPLLIILQFAVLKLGAVFLPADKRYPSERLRFLCSDCDVKLFISDADEIGITDTVVMTSEQLKAYSAEKRDTPVIYSENAYIIYTSGSTGTPKGCLLRHCGLVNFCINNNTLDFLNRREYNVFASVNSVSFDYFIAESMLPILNGFTTVLCDEDESLKQELFLKVIKKHGINVLMTTPTRLALFYDNKHNCEALNALSCVCSSGEPLPEKLLERIYEVSSEAKVFNPLGPSECTVWDLGGELKREDGCDVHIGKPIANTKAYILDNYLNPVPIGVTGELCIAGDGVGAGYLNHSELTAEKFVDNPFGEGKLYKTGDLAYWREDGNIVYVGRNDFQVKVRGLRIETGEVELALTSIDCVSSATVVARHNPDLLVAFYTGKKEREKTLRAELRRKLPSYMIPSRFIHLDSIPVTTSGKIDRTRLSFIDLPGPETELTEDLLPRTPIEKHICNLFSQALSVENINMESNFFDLGGTSLTMISILSEDVFSGITAAEFLASPTPAQLAKILEDRLKQNEAKHLEPLYVPKNFKRSFVLFSYAGGDASAYAALVNEFRERELEIALYYVDWPEQNETYSAIANEIKELSTYCEVNFYSHCAGAVIALKLLEILNSEQAVVKNYIAGASIPPKNRLVAINKWAYLKDNSIINYLQKGGFKKESVQDSVMGNIIRRFRIHTDEFSSYFSSKREKINCKTFAIISRLDPFTKNYIQADILWQKVVTDFEKTILVDYPTHYFQSDNAEQIADYLIKIINDI